MMRVKEGCMMGCSVVGDVEREIIIDGFKTGIMTGHAYGLIDAFEIRDPNMMNPRKTHRILRVRNPWGSMEWKGKWSDKSEEIEKYKALLDKYIASIEDEDERFTPGIEDGTFLINYASWRDIYNNMYICVDFPKEWTGIRYKS
jgi:calpain